VELPYLCFVRNGISTCWTLHSWGMGVSERSVDLLVAGLNTILMEVEAGYNWLCRLIWQNSYTPSLLAVLDWIHSSLHISALSDERQCVNILGEIQVRNRSVKKYIIDKKKHCVSFLKLRYFFRNSVRHLGSCCPSLHTSSLRMEQLCLRGETRRKTSTWTFLW